MCSFQDITNKKLVWFDAPLDTWSTFDLPFQREIWNQNVNWCLNELFDQYSGCKINWDEEGFYNIIDELIEYPIQKILLYRENIWEKVISEELAIQTDHWTSSVGYHRRFKTDYKFDSIDVGVVKERMESAKSQLSYVMNSIGEDLIPYKYEEPKDEFISKNGTPDVIITNPPRDGMHKTVIEQILRIGVKRIVYVSCNSATQARDLSFMNKLYKVTHVQPVDMFPQTHHVENIVVLELK